MVTSALEHKVEKSFLGLYFNPVRALLFGTSNGGTTIFSKSVLQHDDITVFSSTMKTPIKWINKITQYMIYHIPSRTPVLFDKEPFGFKSAHVDFEYLPGEHYSLNNLYLIFLFRDPVRVWNSWRSRQWVREGDMERLYRSYDALLQTFETAQDRGIRHTAICFENFRKDREIYLRKLCTQLGLEYDPTMATLEKKRWGKRGGRKGNPDIDKHAFQVDDTKALIIKPYESEAIQNRLGDDYQKLASLY